MANFKAVNGVFYNLIELEKMSTEGLEASSVAVEADATNEVDAGDLQEVISALAARIKALEDAA